MNPTNRAINITGALAIVLCMVGIQALDAHDATATERALATEKRLAEHQARQEAREWQHRVSVCHRAFGPGTTPFEDYDGNFRCAGSRLKPTKPDIQVAQK